jgi:hypothetical protein
VKQTLVLNPTLRITAKDALRHRWFEEDNIPGDDDTEAAELRQQKL